MAGRKAVTHLWKVALYRAFSTKNFWVTTKTRRLKTLTDSIDKLVAHLYKDEGMHWEFSAVEYMGTIDV